MCSCGGEKPSPPAPPTTPCPAIPAGCEYLKQPYTIESSKADFDRIRDSYKIGPKQAGKHKFPGDAAESDAEIYEVEVKGRKVKVIMPKSGAPSGKNLPTVEQIAKSLAATPGPQLDSMKQVVVSPNQNPSDAYWARQYSIPNFSSAATGGNGGVTFYPKSTPWSQEFTDSTMIHEGGHTYSQELWKEAQKKTDWEEAIRKDNRPPSNYAKSSPSEDFSESLVMYSLSKGTKCEAAAKALYPNRYAALEKLFKK